MSEITAAAHEDEILRACASEPLEKLRPALVPRSDVEFLQRVTNVAIENDRPDLLQYVRSRDGVKPRLSSWDIKAIVRHRSTRLLQVLLDTGWDINEDLGQYSGCALAWAQIGRAPYELTKWLLDHGADPNGPFGGADHCGHSLRLAVQMSDLEVPPLKCAARLLIDRGADVDGSRALHKAAEQGQFAWVRMLVEEYGADVNAPGFMNRLKGNDREMGIGQPLHYAARYGRPELVRYLLEQGADLAGKDTNGRTPEDVARWMGNEESSIMLHKWQQDS